MIWWRAIAHRRDPLAADPLVALLDAGEPFVRRAAAEALARCGAARHAPALAFLEELRRSFRLAQQFDSTFRVDGLTFSKRGIPHDMLYPFPRIEVWLRQ